MQIYGTKPHFKVNRIVLKAGYYSFDISVKTLKNDTN